MSRATGLDSLYSVQLPDLTEDGVEEALAVFRESGWDSANLANVRLEMLASVRGDIPGYVRQHFVLAVIESQIVGVAAWAPSMCSFDIYELSWATVLPQWRHRGVNALLLNRRLEKIREFHGSGPIDVIVCTWVNAMYATAGFLPLLPQGEFHDVEKQERVLLRAHFDK